MEIFTKLRERKDHFVVTIYKTGRKGLDISIGDLLILKLNGYELIRPIRKDYHISLPKNLLRAKSNGNSMNLQILKIVKRKENNKRVLEPIKNNEIRGSPL